MRLALLALVSATSLVACSDFDLHDLSSVEEGEDPTLQPGVDPGPSDDGAADDSGETDDDGQAEVPDDEEPDEEVPEEDPQPEDDPAPEDDCADTSDLIYVLERDDNTLLLFNPDDQGFTALGELDCDSWSQPASMAVGRDGFARVRYSDGAVYAVDLDTLACAPLPVSAPSGFGAFGMGYATDSAGTWRDQLYVADADSLGRYDEATGSVTLLGGLPSQSELTGNAAGELWAFLPLESPAALVEVDKATAAPLQRLSLPGFPDPRDLDAFAFAAWDGEFWLFVRSYGMGNSTDVFRVTAAGELVLERERVGFDVVGAGVSTCAPE